MLLSLFSTLHWGKSNSKLEARGMLVLKQFVDKGECVKCGSINNLHFDDIISFSKGGNSLVAGNIQLLCTRHNISKRDKIE